MLYIKNEDSSAFRIKSYRTEDSNKYPDVSICFWSTAKMLKTDNLPFNISRELLYRLLVKTGNREKINRALRKAGKPENFTYDVLGHMADSGREYVYYLSDPPEEILDTSFVISEIQYMNGTTPKFKNGRKKPNATYSAPKDRVFTTWIDARTPCVTWKIPYNPHEEIHTQNTYLRINRMEAFERMYVFLHPPNQLIRQTGGARHTKMMKTADFVLSDPKKYDKSKKMIEVYLTNTKIIQKRSKPEDLCDVGLHNEDGKWLYEATKYLRCLPIIWSGRIRNQPVCRSSVEYRPLRSLAFDTQQITKRYSPPCKFITYLTYSKLSDHLYAVYNLSAILDDQKLYMLRVIYKKDYYEEISNEKLFNEYDLFCQLGGIVGIMLGFSFLQIPGLTTKVSSVSKSVLQNAKLRYHSN